MIPDGLRKVWRALSGTVPLVPLTDAYDRFDFHQRIGQDEWSPALRTEVLRALEPCIAVRPGWSFGLEALEGEEEPEDSVASVLSFDCELEANQALPTMLDGLRGRADWETILVDLAFDLSGLLRRALDLHAALDAASNDHDPSYIEHPSIEPHNQNRDFHGWTSLIELVREAFDALTDCNLESARSLAGSWIGVPYPLFRRLLLYAARRSSVLEPVALLDTINGDPGRWVWSVETQVELFRTLPWLWEGINAGGRESLLSVVLQGPPREMFRPDLATRDWAEIRDHSTWERLARLNRARELVGEAEECLAQIEGEHHTWRLTGGDREDFPTWMESGWGLPTDFSVESMLALRDDELIQVLKEHQANREGSLDTWRQAAQEDRPRAIRLLGRLRQDRFLDVEVWARGLSALRGLGDDATLCDGALRLLEELPRRLLADPRIVRSVADAVQSLSEEASSAFHSRLLSIWDTALAASFNIPGRETDERVSDAINHPTGILVEAVLLVLRSRPLGRNAGIDEDVRERLERVTDAPGMQARLGRVIVASRLALLHDLDALWARRNIVPRLDWSDPEEAIGAWQGFLWSPWVRPSLWDEIKVQFLGTFDHLDVLSRCRASLAGILASISIEGEDAISALEAGECLRRLDDGGREDVAMWIFQKLRGAGTRATDLWREQIQPWLLAAWPREPHLHGRGASERLAMAATLADEAFAEAAVSVGPLVGQVERGDMILRALREKGFIESAPAECLELVASLTPDEPQPWFGGLRNFLDQVRRVSPGLEDDQRFLRLYRIAVRAGL